MRETLRVHDLKTWREPFLAVVRGHKTHEIRKADRDFRVGDVLVLREYDPTPGSEPGEVYGYTGSWCARLVTYVSEPGTWGLPKDLCVLSLAEFPQLDELRR